MSDFLLHWSYPRSNGCNAEINTGNEVLPRTAFGDSKDFANLMIDVKTQGLCQGNGAAPAGWAVVRITILNAHNQKGHGANSSALCRWCIVIVCGCHRCHVGLSLVIVVFCCLLPLGTQKTLPI